MRSLGEDYDVGGGGVKKVLNLYAGIGGNRKLWTDVEVTAVELNPEIAAIYQDFFPDDTVIVADAHQYLLEHYNDGWDFIWSSPPCPTHSRLRKGVSMSAGAKAVYPDMKLYEEILFLDGYFKGIYCVENVKSWYDPLIKPQELNRHYFWSNFVISDKNIKGGKFSITSGYHSENDGEQVERLIKELGLDISKYKIPVNKKRRLLRNSVKPKVGKHIFDSAFNHKQETLELV